MRVLDIFSGIGGFSLGLESIGMHTVAFCEQDGYARRVLRKHWPETWLYDDVRTLTAKRLEQDGIGSIDLICGGFPCQDISCAGKGAGIEGARSGLWSEYARIIREIKPRWVIAENVPALRGRGADRVLGDLEGAGYAAWPLVVGALHAGAPHRRQRAWIVAHSDGLSGRSLSEDARDGQGWQGPEQLMEGRSSLAHTQGGDAGQLGTGSEGQSEGPTRPERRRGLRNQPGGCGEALSDTPGRDGHDVRRIRPQGDARRHGLAIRPWAAEPDVGRVADGVPARVDRLRCLGNAVIPQVVAMIGRAVLDFDRA